MSALPEPVDQAALAIEDLEVAYTVRGVKRAAFVGMFNATEVMAVRPEDKDARQDERAFASGATLAELAYRQNRG